MSRPFIVAHRGSSKDAPENTLAAFHRAWNQGADAVEADLRLTADRRIVLIHDPDGLRTLRIRKAIAKMKFDEVRTYDAGSWKHPRWRAERVPALGELVASLPPDRHLYLELKEDLVAELAEELAHAPLARITLIAFDSGIISRAKAALPACQALWLFADYARLPRFAPGEALLQRVQEMGIDGLDLRYGRHLTAEFTNPLRAVGLPLATYVVNTRRAMLRCLQAGVTRLTTDVPHKTRTWLSGAGAFL